MFKTLPVIAIIGLTLPFGLFGASENKNAERTEKTDQELASKIQKAVSKDSSLSPSSREVQVTVQNGMVTLVGTVQSEAERQAIQGKAESLATQQTPDELIANSSGVKVDNKLVVAPHS